MVSEGIDFAIELFKSLIKLGACARKMNELKALMVDGSNADEVNELHLEFQRALNEFY